MFFEEQIEASIRRQNLGQTPEPRRDEGLPRPPRLGRVGRRKKRVVVLERDGFRCVKCHNTNLSELTMDHIWPRCRKGCYCAENLQVLCVNCNQAKGTRFQIVDGVIQGHPRGHCPRT